MRNTSLGLVAAMTLALASPAMAGLLGSPVTGSTSATGATTINPNGSLGSTTVGAGSEFGFCVGNPLNCVSGGVSSSVNISDTAVAFTFFGSTNNSSTGSFNVSLSGFNPVIQNVVYSSGGFDAFSLTSFSSTSMVFHAGPGPFNAIGGNTITFGVTTVSPVAEPGTLALLGSGLAGLGLMWRHGRRQQG